MRRAGNRSRRDAMEALPLLRGLGSPSLPLLHGETEVRWRAGGGPLGEEGGNGAGRVLLYLRRGMKQQHAPQAGLAKTSTHKQREKGNLIDAGGVVAAPPHYPPLVEPLRPGPTLVPHTPSNPLTNLRWYKGV